MFNFKKVELNKVKQIFIKIPTVLGENTFKTLFGLLIIALLLGVAVFFKYNISTEEVIDVNEAKVLKFKEDAFNAILTQLEDRYKQFQETDLKKTYPDPFKASASGELTE